MEDNNGILLEPPEPEPEGEGALAGQCTQPSEASDILERVTNHQTRAGRVGGLSRSPRKRESSRANLAAARLKRWAGREASARAALSLPSTSPPNGTQPPHSSPDGSLGPLPDGTAPLRDGVQPGGGSTEDEELLGLGEFSRTEEKE